MKLARPDLGDPEVLLHQLHLYEGEAVDKWRSKWIRSNAHISSWRLIEDAATFQKMKRNIEHYTDTNTTLTCPDGAEHALLRCPRWAIQRTTLESVVGDTLIVNNCWEHDTFTLYM